MENHNLKTSTRVASRETDTSAGVRNAQLNYLLQKWIYKILPAKIESGNKQAQFEIVSFGVVKIVQN